MLITIFVSNSLLLYFAAGSINSTAAQVLAIIQDPKKSGGHLFHPEIQAVFMYKYILTIAQVAGHAEQLVTTKLSCRLACGLTGVFLFGQ